MYYTPAKLEELIGKVLTKVEGKIGDDDIVFTCEDGKRYLLYHSQNCCESVTVDDIVGELEWLEGSPVLIAREDSSDAPKVGKTYDYRHGGYTDESFTWTFYNFATAKGHVTIKWYGTSNGHYSEDVDFGRADMSA